MGGIQPITAYSNEQVQFLGKYAVDEYNKKGESYLYFIEVVNGTVLTFPRGFIINWDLQLKAKNCSDHDSTALYSTLVIENKIAGDIEAFGSKFIAVGVMNKL
ncbi:Phloem filament protein PP1 cystatin-like domain-containing protein [Carex littledalei]|uniref:Phloem filament protein PP1 cystatin-like domain-containing protein n=1 Tax=Carex littledalei TaxID=544730 RepID=A0A833RFT6_9POAL|nr:Phloem filament protein PP1 cystatin-like domain-containing protein [Carex littledalei]